MKVQSDIGLKFADTDPESSSSELEDLVATAEHGLPPQV